MGNYTIFQMLENPRRGRQARYFTTNVPKILHLKPSSEQIFAENCRWVPLVDSVLNFYQRFSYIASIFQKITRQWKSTLSTMQKRSPVEARGQNTLFTPTLQKSEQLLLNMKLYSEPLFSLLCDFRYHYPLKNDFCNQTHKLFKRTGTPRYLHHLINKNLFPGA